MVYRETSPAASVMARNLEAPRIQENCRVDVGGTVINVGRDVHILDLMILMGIMTLFTLQSSLALFWGEIIRINRFFLSTQRD